ncbi:probable receptor-like protein kinase At1g80640 isoform X2 [Andrographis paniculata]|uniref:probable receptor-like protein kinase At1g80640 isoform X2 n=1 Tax=Andrographis paniculata TaxID=175694 RepID=UPI0021E6DC7A|nr:probable receptor-like protein kinase At1g80640 isoform X2 [Andrographis paniculata]
MKGLFMFLAMISVWISIFASSSSSPVDVKADPPVADPVLPIQREPFFKNSSDLIAHPPDVKVVVHHQDLNKNLLIALVVSSSLLAAILLGISCFFIYRVKFLKKFHETDRNSVVNLLKINGKKGSIAAIDYQLLVIATSNFDDSNILGQGGLGVVYKAHFNDNFHAAVKRIYGGGHDAVREFENEVEALSKIRHQNIVSLLGYCIHNEARFLIYEIMENGSLDFHLHGPSHGSALTWQMRMKIALDVARGLEYLHEHCNPPVIHRDLKSSNILLDSKFNAKLSDFGLAMISGGSSNKANIKLSGSVGYVAPEYLLDGKLTDKSDVYAFGVILLELLMGRRPVERVSEAQCQSIVTWAMPQLTDRSKLPNIVDPAIKNSMDLKHLYQVAAIAVLCVQPEPSYRPLITDVLHSFMPLVPVDLGGSLRLTEPAAAGGAP